VLSALLPHLGVEPAAAVGRDRGAREDAADVLDEPADGALEEADLEEAARELVAAAHAHDPRGGGERGKGVRG
jgi:hypothetical protein